MKKILVSGGAGFIGSNLVDALIQENYEVAVVDNLATGLKENINPKAKFFEIDISSFPSVDDVFKQFQPEAVFHLAAQASVRKSVEDPGKDVKTNVIGTVNLLKACQAHGVKKFIFSSTGGALYGDDASRPTTEEASISPISPYGLDKLFGEKYIGYFKSNSDLQTVVLRYANVYGPKQNPKGEAGVIAIFADKMLKDEPIMVYGDGSSSRDYVYVGDVVEANLAALKSTVSNAYNISTGEETSIRELVDKIKKITDSNSQVQFKEGRSGELQASCLDNTRAKLELGWSPKVNLDEGIRKTVEYLKSIK